MMFDDQEPKWLHCCPHWLMNQPAISDATNVAYWAKDGNLSAFYNAANPMPVKLRNMAKVWEAGYSGGLDDRPKPKTTDK